MTQFTFTKATKEQARLRLALFGPSGSGKTFTSLQIATGIGGKVAVIDTERGSASKYADRFDFDVLNLPQNDIATYVKAIQAASNYNVLIIDSLSHGWFELREEVEKIARAKYRGNTWSAWSEGTPKQRQLVDAILDFDGHIIATMRVKTDWVVESTQGGKTRPVRVGLAPQQGKGIEYEFDLLGELSIDHILQITKDRTGKFQDQVLKEPGQEFGKQLAEWLKDGAPKKREQKTKTEPLSKDAVTNAAEEDFGAIAITDEPFASANDAITWGLSTGAFKARKHAENAYNKIKTEKNPQTAQEMALLWRQDVSDRLAQ